jgi:hypothetical protein
MTLVGCTDKEISDAFECALTAELLEHVQKVREFGKSRIPTPTPQAVARERQRQRLPSATVHMIDPQPSQ